MKKLYERNGFVEYKKNKFVYAPAVEKVEPIRKLGTGANVYFESPKYRVNDSQNGKVLLNVYDNTGALVPKINVEFDNATDAVKVAEIIEKEYPEGLPPEYATEGNMRKLAKEGNVWEQMRNENEKLNNQNIQDENNDLSADKRLSGIPKDQAEHQQAEEDVAGLEAENEKEDKPQV